MLILQMELAFCIWIQTQEQDGYGSCKPHNALQILPLMGMETGDHAVFYTLQHYYLSDPSKVSSHLHENHLIAQV